MGGNAEVCEQALVFGSQRENLSQYIDYDAEFTLLSVHNTIFNEQSGEEKLH